MTFHFVYWFIYPFIYLTHNSLKRASHVEIAFHFSLLGFYSARTLPLSSEEEEIFTFSDHFRTIYSWKCLFDYVKGLKPDQTKRNKSVRLYISTVFIFPPLHLARKLMLEIFYLTFAGLVMFLFVISQTESILE